MKRYAVFAGDYNYPRGGVEDYRASFDTLEDAVQDARVRLGPEPWQGAADWAHVWDIATGEVHHVRRKR